MTGGAGDTGNDTRRDVVIWPWHTRWRDVWPFLGVGLIGVATVPLGWRQPSLLAVGLFVVLTSVTLGMIVVSVELGRRTWLAVAAPLMVFLDLAVVRYLAGPTLAAGITPLVLLPMLWIALRGTRAELVVAGVLSAAFFWVPVALIGPPRYPDADWYRGLLTAAIALLVAPVIQRMVQQLAAAHADERAARQQTAAITARSRALLAQLPDTVVGVVGERDGRVVVLERLGGSADLHDEFAEVLHRHGPAMRNLLTRAVDGRAEVELHDRTSARTLAVIAVPLPETTPVELLLVARDVSREKRRERDLERSRRRLAYLADHDPVSGLLNRRRFDQVLAEHLREPTGNGRGAVLMVDLDLFKQVNDTLGHAAGDRLIVRVARILRAELRSGDAAARLGGDEFAVLLPDAAAADAETVAGRLVRRIGESVAGLGDGHPPVTASIGVATVAAARAHGGDPLELADSMLYEAKAGGGARYAIFDSLRTNLPAMARTTSWQERLARAVHQDGLVLQLQPILDLAQSRVVTAEALARIREDDRLIPPAEFIDAAEGSGLITQVDCQIVRRGIGMLAQLRRRDPGFRLAINVSARSVGESALEETIVDSLTAEGLPGSALIIEVTETAALTQIDRAHAFAERMHAWGCTLALDDFGSGFGTFARVKRLPFDYIKIYGEFVAAAAESEVDRALMRSIIRVSHELGKRVVAEHVTDQRTFDLVVAEGADLVQGFHIGRPVGIEQFLARYLPDEPSEHRTDQQAKGWEARHG